jgi:hypothetical protein
LYKDRGGPEEEKNFISLAIIQVASTTNTCTQKMKAISVNKLIWVTKFCTCKSFTMHHFSCTVVWLHIFRCYLEQTAITISRVLQVFWCLSPYISRKKTTGIIQLVVILVDLNWEKYF